MPDKFIGGFIPEPLEETAWLFGGLPRPDLLESGNWHPYKPTPEKQATKYFDPYSCVSESLTNAMEELLALMMEKDPNTKLILEELKCLDDNGKPNLSGRFLAVKSGTIPGRGNTQLNVFSAARNYGFVGEKVWPTNPEMTQSQYFSPIPQEVMAMASKWHKYFEKMEYEAFSENTVSSNEQLREATKKGPLVAVVGGFILGNTAGAILYRNDGPVSYNHQINYVYQETNVSDFSQTIPVIHDIFDTYDPFDKKVYEKYPFAWARIIYLSKKKIPMIYKKIGQPAMAFKHWSEDALIAFADGSIPGGDLFKSLFGVEKYSDLPRQDVEEWPYPIKYHLTTTGLETNLE